MAPMTAAEDRGSDLFMVMTVFLAVSGFFILLRCYVRLCITKSFMVDDWFMLVAMINYILLAVFVYLGISSGLGKHNQALSQEKRITAIKYQALVTSLYVSSMALVKLSIGFFLLRIAILRRYIWTLKISMTILTIWTLGIFFFTIFQCSPVEAQWDFTIPGSKCVSSAEFVRAAYAFSVLAILSDWLYALMPIPMLWGVNMSARAKAVVIGILSLGIFASVATLVRVQYLVQLENLDDILYSGTDSLLWSIIEIGISIIAASAVTMRPLLRALKIEGFSSAADSRYRPRSGYALGDDHSTATELTNRQAIIRKDITVEHKLSQVDVAGSDGISESGSEEGILGRETGTMTRVWCSSNDRISGGEP